MNIEGSAAIIKLNDDNYQIWKHQVKLLLKAKRVWHTIEKEKPEPTETNAKEIEKFQDSSALAASMILSSLEPSQAQQVLKLDESKEIWYKLEQIHEGKKDSRRVNLRLDLSTIKLKDKENIEKYLARAQYLRDQLEQCDSKIENEEFIGLLLNGLPNSYRGLRVQMKTTGLDKISLEEFRSGLKAQEEELKLEGIETELQAACISKERRDFTKQKTKVSGTCWVCNKRGHRARDCYQRADKRDQKDGQTSQKQEKNDNKANTAVGGEASYECAMNVSDKNQKLNCVWYLDSGATSHMTCDKSLFVNIEEIQNSSVKLADGKFIKIEGIGTVRVKNTNKNCFYQYINVTEVLYVPEITENLLSISAFEKKGFKVEFRDGICEIKKDNGILMMTGKRVRNLYEAEIQNLYNVEEAKLSVEMWHRRYGHQNFVTLNEMKNKELVSGLDFSNKSNVKCEDCIMGKLVKKPFTKHPEVKAKNILELVHMDLCGPMQEPSVAGSKYMYLLVDDYSRKVFVFFIKSKDEALCKFKIFKNEVENQTNSRIKRIRSDNGGEFVNKNFKNFLQEHGIIHEVTAPYTPQENGIAERNNRTIIQMVRCMLNDAKLHLKFWAEAAYYAVYLKNRTYSRKVDTTPEEKFTGQKPNVEHLKIFGSLAYYLIDKQKRRKLDQVSKEAIFVGYDHLTKHPRVFCIERGIIITVRDAEVIETRRGAELLRENEEKYDYIKIKYSPDEDEVIEVQNQDQADEHFENSLVENENDEIQNNNNYDLEEQENSQSEAEVSSLEEQENDNIDRELYPRENDNDSYDSEDSELDDGEKDTTEIDPDYQPTVSNLEVEIRKSGRISTRNIDNSNLVAENVNVPTCFEEAMSSINKIEWKQAIKEELMSHHSNKTWEIVDRPKNKQVIDSKWVFKIKENMDGTVDKFKARLVARGFNQRKGDSYDEIFAPVIRHSMLRIVFAIATECDLDFYQLDVTTAYLHGTLQEEIYMEIPCGLGQNGVNKVCRLRKGLYGLKQSARVWYKTIKNELEQLEFKELDSSPCVFLYDKKEIYMIVCLYVDDILWATNSKEVAFTKINELKQKFSMKFIGEVKYLLGWEVKRDKEKGITYLKQEKYIKKCLRRFNMTECKGSTVPMQPQSNKLKQVESKAMEDVPYQELIGSLIYLSQGTRPDITFATTYLSQFNNKYSRENWTQAKLILRYLKETATEGITYKKCGEILEVFSDASWNNELDGKGFSGYLCKYAGAAINWQCKKQEVVALSTCESEFIALTEAIRELVWMKYVFTELKQEEKLGVLTVYGDNQAAIKLTNNSVYHARSKHIQRRYFYIRDEIDRHNINLKYIESKANVADFLTKPVTRPILENCKRLVGMGQV